MREFGCQPPIQPSSNGQPLTEIGCLPVDPTASSAPDAVKALVRQQGFDLVGIAPCGPIAHVDAFDGFLANGWAGTMHYLQTHRDTRVDSRGLFPGASRAIVAAINYWHEAPAGWNDAASQPRRGQIARYAWSRDYHLMLKRKLHVVADAMRARWPACQTTTCVDSAPVHERDLATAAGLGWIGKHTLLLNRDVGSWLLLGVIITNVPLVCDAPVSSHCGSCTACLDACPTGALRPDRPFRMEARRCISYTTIELDVAAPATPSDSGNASGATELWGIDRAVAEHTSPWVFGCDICQEVCPFNRTRQLPATDPSMAPIVPDPMPLLQEMATWSESQRIAAVGGSGAKRASLEQWHRNAAVALHSDDASRGSSTEPPTGGQSMHDRVTA